MPGLDPFSEGGQVTLEQAGGKMAKLAAIRMNQSAEKKHVAATESWLLLGWVSHWDGQYALETAKEAIIIVDAESHLSLNLIGLSAKAWYAHAAVVVACMEGWAMGMDEQPRRMRCLVLAASPSR